MPDTALRRFPLRSAVAVVVACLLSGCAVITGTARPPAAAPVATIPLADSPVFLAMAPDGKRLYAAAGARLSVIDTATDSVTHDVAVDPHAAGIAVSPDGARVYVSHLFNDRLTVFHTGTGEVVEKLLLVGAKRPGGWGALAVSPDRSIAIVTNRERERIAVVDIVARDAGTVSPGMRPRDVALSPDGRTAYICGCPGFCSTGAIEIFDTTSRRFTGDITVGANPYRVVLSPDGGRAYTANLGGATVSVADLVSRSVVATLPAPPNPTGLAVSSDGARLYATSNANGEVAVYDTANLIEVARVRAAARARDIALSADDRRAYVSTPAGIVVLDTTPFSAGD